MTEPISLERVDIALYNLIIRHCDDEQLHEYYRDGYIWLLELIRLIETPTTDELDVAEVVTANTLGSRP